MNQPNQENSAEASLLQPAKRKRGRPRKDRTLNRLGAVPAPPGFQVTNGSVPPHVNPVKNANNSIIGQTVTGVVEATFDAGYLLAVKIGNSSTTLRGVVFKPGHYAPVTAENDVAPHVQMIKRNETHLSSENKTRVRGRKPRQRSREAGMQLVSYVGNGGPSSLKGNYVPAPSVPLVGARGTVVPVLLQPVNLANGASANESANRAALKGKHVQTVLPLSVYPPNGSTNQALPLQPQISSQGTSGVQQAGGQGEELADMNEPLFVEPLQTRHNLHSQNAAFFKPVQINGTGRMSELLQAMQDNLIQSQMPRAQHHTQGFTVDFQQPKNTEIRGSAEETQEQTHTRAQNK